MEKQKRIVAIHDISCVGRCSLTVALPILSAAGFDTGVLPTAVLSTHTGGFEGFTYRDLTDDILPITRHWESLGLAFDAMYSGFLGSFKQIDLIAELFETFNQENTLIMVDPVMADHGQLYSVYSQDMVQGMAKLCQQAHLIVPNITEASFILNRPYKEGPYTKEYIEEMLKSLAELGPDTIVLTGVYFDNQKLGAAAYQKIDGTISYAFADRIEGHFHGTGDVYGSTLLAAILNGFSMDKAIQISVDYTVECIRHTIKLGQERRYGVCFEKALPYLMNKLF